MGLKSNKIMITFDPSDIATFVDSNFVWDFPDTRKEAATQLQEKVIGDVQKYAYERCESLRRDLYSWDLNKAMAVAAAAAKFREFGKIQIGESTLEFSFTLSSELLFDFDVVSKWTHRQYSTFRSMILHVDSLPCCRTSLFELTDSAFENTPNLHQILDKNTKAWPII